MAGSKQKQAERNAGAFYSPDGIGMIPIPMRTLSDEYEDLPVDPPDDHEPEPEPPGLVQRILERLSRKPDPGR